MFSPHIIDLSGILPPTPSEKNPAELVAWHDEWTTPEINIPFSNQTQITHAASSSNTSNAQARPKFSAFSQTKHESFRTTRDEPREPGLGILRRPRAVSENESVTRLGMGSYITSSSPEATTSFSKAAIPDFGAQSNLERNSSWRNPKVRFFDVPLLSEIDLMSSSEGQAKSRDDKSLSFYNKAFIHD